MGLDISAKLMGCRNYTEAKPILETLGASKASHELMQLYYAQPENSPYKTRFMGTVVQELEDGIETKKDKSGPHDEGKINEVDGGQSTQSSGDKPEMEGQNKGTVVGDSSAQPTESQMKETPMMGMPGMPPEIQQQMMTGLEKQPPMNPLQQMKMMQYTIQETLKGPLAEIKRIGEGLAAIDSKIQEMETKSVSLEIPGGNDLVTPKYNIQETMPTPQNQVGYGAQPQPQSNIEEKRMQISEADRIMTAKKDGKDVSTMYQ
jgi:hypothetical protein